jgi:malic enzyme
VTALPSVSYSITVRLGVPAGESAVSQLTTAVEQVGGVVTALDVTASGNERLRIDVTCAARDTEHAEQLVEAMRSVPDVVIDKISDRTFLMHLGGKIAMHAKHSIHNRADLSMIYTPGVARDGSAVAGLGNLGPEAALPVMEGKAAVFKRFGEVDAWPLSARHYHLLSTTRSACSLLDAHCAKVTSSMLLAAAGALAGVVSDDELNAAYIMPSVFHADVHHAGAAAVRKAAGGPTELRTDTEVFL